MRASLLFSTSSPVPMCRRERGLLSRMTSSSMELELATRQGYTCMGRPRNHRKKVVGSANRRLGHVTLGPASPHSKSSHLISHWPPPYVPGVCVG